MTHVTPQCWFGPVGNDLPGLKATKTTRYKCTKCGSEIKNLHRSATHRNTKRKICNCRSFEEINI